MATEKVTQKVCRDCRATYTGTRDDPSASAACKRHKERSGHGGFKAVVVPREVRPTKKVVTASKSAKATRAVEARADTRSLTPVRKVTVSKAAIKREARRWF
jgi:hypothetical protein